MILAHRLAASLLFLLGTFLPPAAFAQGVTGGNPQSTIQCTNTIIYDANTNGVTKIITAVANRNIFICGYVLFAAGTVNVSLVYGTNVMTDCDTGQTVMTPAYQFTAQTGVVDHTEKFGGLYAATGKDVCLKTSAGIAVQAIVYYRAA